MRSPIGRPAPTRMFHPRSGTSGEEFKSRTTGELCFTKTGLCRDKAMLASVPLQRKPWSNSGTMTPHRTAALPWATAQTGGLGSGVPVAPHPEECGSPVPSPGTHGWTNVTSGLSPGRHHSEATAVQPPNPLQEPEFQGSGPFTCWGSAPPRPTNELASTLSLL